MLITVESTSPSKFHAALNVLAIVQFLAQLGFGYIMYN